MKKWKQWISINLAGLLMAGTLFGAGSIDAQAAEYWPDNVSVSSGAAIVVEMETGTGKTFVYIKTIFELNKRYGWSKKRFAPFGTVCYNSRCEK